jgi:aspartyl-tRNA synthetase
MQTKRRTHTCGELREADIGQAVTLCGWVNTARAYNDQVFFDLRDRYGLTQVVVEAETPPTPPSQGGDRHSSPPAPGGDKGISPPYEGGAGGSLFELAHEIRPEWVISVRGKVRERLPGKHNPKLATGDIEVLAEKFEVLNRCPTPPFEVMSVTQDDQSLGDPELANEDLRLQYRYLDLRRPSLQRTLAMRHQLNKVIHAYLSKLGFLELETPLLGRSTPEGARDYLVPSRLFPGSWYALPQSPQIYKQLLMVAGYDRYYQIAHCLRDEDLRADRQPEFTQLDVEMSFVEMDDVFKVLEGLTAEIFGQCLGVSIPLPLPRLSYSEVMRKYGSDKPDLRFGLEIVELTDWVGQTEFKVFQSTVAAGGKVRGINVPGGVEKFSRKQLDELTPFAQRCGAKGISWIKVEAEKLTSPVEKFLPAAAQQSLRQKTGAKAGDLLLLVADKEEVVCQTLGTLRGHLANHLKLVDPAKRDFKIAWVIDFPSFIWDAEEKRWAANHHPFTAPKDEYLDVLKHATEADLANPHGPLAAVTAKAYDLVINGYECAGGSIRIHSPEVQSALFRVLGMTEEQAKHRFGFLLDALKYGAPPHGGIALGLDRWAMMLAGTTNIRDVIAFPKNQKARDLMTGATAPVDAKQLKELGL